MKDTISKGAGNSRTLRTVPNAMTLYPTHEAMIADMINGTFPIDLGPLNPAGLEQIGTELSKGTLFSDSAGENFGLGTTGTPDQAFRMLIPAVSGTYAGGSGGTTESSAKTLTFNHLPKLMFISAMDADYSYPVGVFRPSYIKDDGEWHNGQYFIISTVGYNISTLDPKNCKAKRNGNTISWYCSHLYGELFGFNRSLANYFYIALG